MKYKTIKIGDEKVKIPKLIEYSCVGYNEGVGWVYQRNRNAEKHGEVVYQCTGCAEVRKFTVGDLEKMINKKDVRDE